MPSSCLACPQHECAPGFFVSLPAAAAAGNAGNADELTAAPAAATSCWLLPAVASLLLPPLPLRLVPRRRSDASSAKTRAAPTAVPAAMLPASTGWARKLLPADAHASLNCCSHCGLPEDAPLLAAAANVVLLPAACCTT
jgi:hypothetical protein